VLAGRGGPPASPLAPAPARVAIDVRTIPPGAALVMDGQPIANPYHVDVAPDSSTHGLYASLTGYGPVTDHVTFEGAKVVVLTLEPEAPVAPARVGPHVETKVEPSVGAELRAETKVGLSAAAKGGAGAAAKGGAGVETKVEPKKRGHGARGPAPSEKGYRGSKLEIDTDFPGGGKR
jgi:hypothetical protein